MRKLFACSFYYTRVFFGNPPVPPRINWDDRSTPVPGGRVAHITTNAREDADQHVPPTSGSPFHRPEAGSTRSPSPGHHLLDTWLQYEVREPDCCGPIQRRPNQTRTQLAPLRDPGMCRVSSPHTNIRMTNTRHRAGTPREDHPVRRQGGRGQASTATTSGDEQVQPEPRSLIANPCGASAAQPPAAGWPFSPGTCHR